MNYTHHISRTVSLLSLCGPEDFVLLAPAQWLLRLAGREVSQLLHQWQSCVISDLLSGYSLGSISSPRQTRLLDEENSPVPSYWSFYSRPFTFLVFSHPRGAAIYAYSLMHEMRSHSSFQFLPEKEIKPHLVFWLLVNERFRMRSNPNSLTKTNINYTILW
jgi:hypothetical protein